MSFQGLVMQKLSASSVTQLHLYLPSVSATKKCKEPPVLETATSCLVFINKPFEPHFDLVAPSALAEAPSHWQRLFCSKLSSALVLFVIWTRGDICQTSGRLSMQDTHALLWRIYVKSLIIHYYLEFESVGGSITSCGSWASGRFSVCPERKHLDLYESTNLEAFGVQPPALRLLKSKATLAPFDKS